MAQILLYGGILILAGAIAFAVLRQVKNGFSNMDGSSSAADTQPSTSPDFRPRDGSGAVMETMASASMPVNPDHPSHKYLEEIQAKFTEAEGDVMKLFPPERNFMLAYRFEEELNGQGLLMFLRIFCDRKTWESTKDALYIVRADEYASVFNQFLETDGAKAAEALARGKLVDFRFSKDWDAMLIGSRTGKNKEEIDSYMERRLDYYCEEGDA